MVAVNAKMILAGLAATLGLSACADGYGYGGVDAGTGYYSDGYYGQSDYYGQPGYYGSGAYGGWYGDYYYPGSGYYVFDRGGNRRRWDDRQRAYWEQRRAEYHRNHDDRRPDGGRDNQGRDNQGRGGPRQWGNDRPPPPAGNPYAPNAAPNTPQGNPPRQWSDPGRGSRNPPDRHSYPAVNPVPQRGEGQDRARPPRAQQPSDRARSQPQS